VRYLDITNLDCSFVRSARYSVAIVRFTARGRYGLVDDQSPGARAMFLMDAWSGFFSTGRGEDLRRTQFYKTRNIETPEKPPGGWSCHGQPCDQLHSQFRKQIRAHDLDSLGMVGDLRTRTRALIHVSKVLTACNPGATGACGKRF